ncbi:MAG: tetratricopeptide repeat protein [Myxococcota bacterium]
MRIRPGRLTLGITLASVAVTAVLVRWRDSRGEEALAEANALLDPPFSEAPSLDAIRVSEAMGALEEAADYGTTEVGLRDYAEALGHYQRGDLVFAEASLTASRQAAGTSTRVSLLEAAIAQSQGQLERAEEAAKEALARSPEDPRALLLHADLALDRDDGRAALVALSRLLEDAPGFAPLHNRRGLALEAAGEMDAAHEAYRRAVDADPSEASAWINLGRTLRARGEDATEAFDHATEAAPEHPDAWLGRGLAALDHGDFEDATEALERARELAPHDAASLVGLGDVALRQGDAPEALTHYRAAVRDLPLDAALWVKLGNALVRTGELAPAEQAFRRAVGLNDGLAAAYNGLGAVLLQAGNDEEAATSLERAAALDPADPHPFMNLALLHERSGRRHEAATAWRAALARDPSSAIASARLAAL